MGVERVRQPDRIGRGVGLAVFAAGIILLVVVFVWTQRLGGQELAPADKVPLDRWLMHNGLQVAKLLISGLLASWIAGRGAHLYAAAGRATSGDSLSSLG